MRELSRKSQIYLWLVYSTGALALAAAVPLASLGWAASGAQRWALPVFLILAALAGSKKVNLVRAKSERGAGTMSLLFPLAFGTMLHLGPWAGVLAVAFGSACGGLFPRRLPAHQMLFNVALTAVSNLLAGSVFLRMNGGVLTLTLEHSLPAIVLACLTYYAINTGGVATIIALSTDGNPFQVWKQTFLWTAPSYFAGACISAVALLIFRSHVAVAVLFVLPVAYLIYQSYVIYIGRAEEKQQYIERLAGVFLSTIKSLALAIDAKDQYTHQHILRVQRYAVATATKMGITGDELEGINTGALLHDIGKLGVPEYVLLKPGRLTDEEFAKIKKHPEIGAAILGPVEFPWPVLPVVRSHHEKWDGTGYPDGLAGEDIPLSARVLAVADVYDALTSSRSYRSAWTHERTVAEIERCSGTHFDPRVAEAFLQVIDGVVAEMAQEAQRYQDVTPESRSEKQSQEAVRDIQRASSELWALYEIAQTLSSSLGLKETLDILSRKLEAILPGTACLFLLKEEGKDELVVRAAVGINHEFLDGARTLNAESISRGVLHSQQSYLGDYDLEDLLMIKSPTAQWEPLRTSLIVPIIHQGEVLGTINLYHPTADAFGEHDQQLLETIAERAAMALYNGLLFDRTRSHAITDPLTGLYNVRHLTQYVEDLCKGVDGGEGSKPFALLCLDLDSFKPINDNFGHQKGDQVLCDLSRLFLAAVGPEDVVARYGGDEFLLVLQGAGMAEAEEAACRLQSDVEDFDPGLVHERLGALYIGASVGVACFPSDGYDCASLLAAADAQMYRNKLDRKLGALASARRAHDAGDTEQPALPLAA